MQLSVAIGQLIEDIQRATKVRLRDVEGIRGATSSALAAHSSRRRRFAREQKAQMNAFITGLRRDTGEFVAALSRAKQEQMRRLREALAADLRTLRSDTEDFRKRLCEGHAGVRADLADFRKHLNEERATFRADLATAHNMWSGFSATRAKPKDDSEAEIGRETTADSFARTDSERQSDAKTQGGGRATEAASRRGDLISIEGIGPIMKERLCEVGVKSVARLAAADAESLRKQLGDVGRFADVNSWITQARKMVGEE